jgi:uncharacterized Zn-finger protein
MELNADNFISKLGNLADEFGVSRERVRRIDVSSFKKVQNAMKNRGAAAGALAMQCYWRFRQPIDAKGEPLTGVLIEPLLDDPCTSALCISVGRRALQMESYPKFHNELGVSIVRIGCREFKCIGEKPPQDHPHIYLNMGDTGEIICPYCSTLFRFDPTLGAHEADPADCLYDDVD